MGLFKRKTSKLSTYDEKINGSQTSTVTRGLTITPTSTFSNKSNSDFHLHSPAMSLSNIPIPGPPDPGVDPAAYLKSIHAVRDRSKMMMRMAMSSQLSHFDVNMDMFQNTADYVVSMIKVCPANTSPADTLPI